MIRATVKVDFRNFNAAFKRYMKATSRTLTEVVNKKAGLIAVQALNNTKRADRSSIENTLGSIVTTTRQTRKGRTVKSKKLSLVKSNSSNAPLAALIVNKRRAAKGLPGLEGAQMAQAIRKLLGGKFRSIGFLASGWIQAIKRIQAAAGSLGLGYNRSVRQYGESKGGAIPAKESLNPIATIFNEIDAHANPRAAEVIRRGVQQALNKEAASMDAYVEKKMSKDAAAF